MPKLNQYRTAKTQVESFKELGCLAVFAVQEFAPAIVITKGAKSYRFCDPDWNVVISQLAKLYGVIKNEKRMYV